MAFTGDLYSSSYRRIYSDAPRRMTSASSRYAHAAPRVGSRLALDATTDLAHTAAVTNEMKIIRTSEKEQLQGLNDRFVCFIEKVRALEQRNRALEAEAAQLRERHREPSRLRDLYEREVRDLRARADELARDASRLRVERAQAGEALESAREQLAEETRRREEAERGASGCRRDAEEAALARHDLERRVEALLEEIEFLRRVHEEELREMQVSVEMDVSRPDLAVALKDIRSQYEALSSRNQLQADEWYRSKFASVTEAASRNNDAIKQAKDELGDCRRQVQARTLEVEALRGHNEALERQLAEMEERHSNEISEMQEAIQQLEEALRGTKGEMSRHLREYQELLNVKMALDIEIAAYRSEHWCRNFHFKSV
uniref:Zgc:65851 n=1 Tax=Astyanax mexicanus TaxID=7994 RepID=A0A8B9R6H9_ASTMX